MVKRSVRSILIAALPLLLLAAAAAQAQPSLSGPCVAAQQRCNDNCAGLSNHQQSVTCMMGCDNAAAQCTTDPEPTLKSEDYLALFGDGIFTTQSACHSTTPCPAEYDSCAAWSSYSDCGEPYCGIYGHCGSGCGEPLCFDEATRQRRERFRVCFNQQSQSCTEYQWTSVVESCGC